ncbi:ABC transporter ATP-binding protein [Fusibacter paucivorans]|uniref:ABC transporter ATP-binding protein n=1 Tax=Fusibacter paucivorans TaxID=76009 RepID=A0ABS5PN20_9FIRM|nr:ABC transporter ATP-binding protein [Fusibacter paucivorans]MBS7525961.1 ABC transporter ATP-binding protein [Fusibacter paucivorans]
MELAIDRVTKRYANKIACDRISLTLHAGVYGLLGANGAGKTTLMRMMCGVLAPTSGTIAFDGIDVNHEDYRDVLGYLPQDFGYYPEFTAQNFMLYIAMLKGLPKVRAMEKSRELLELVSLEKEAKKKIKTFSGGMKQRLGIAQSLLNDPKILILDEPTAGLDPKERVRFRNLISRLGAKRIVLLSTHIVSDVEHIADTILLMKNGQLIHQGTLEQIIDTITGKVWECSVSQEAAEIMCEKHPVINIRQEGEKIFLRLICENPPQDDATGVTATLEDLYLYYFSGVNEQ